MTNLTTSHKLYLSGLSTPSQKKCRKPWTPIRGHFKWDVPGVIRRHDSITRPWRVKFNRKEISVSVGVYATLREAQAAARAFLEEERND